MISAFLSALSGRCPCCGRGKLYQSFLKLNVLCPVCHVRFERWSGSWTIPTVMGYGAGALFAIALGIIFFKMDRLDGAENIIIPATLVFTFLIYPLCKNISIFMLFQNGFIFVDPPTLVQDTPTGALEPDEPTREERVAPDQDDPTDGGGAAA
jgi:uncharacterized protein (DUF983 family)